MNAGQVALFQTDGLPAATLHHQNIGQLVVCRPVDHFPQIHHELLGLAVRSHSPASLTRTYQKNYSISHSSIRTPVSVM
jgi:hypothetical protein